MHEIYLVCLLGGFATTALFAALGALGGGHLHVGHAGPAGHAHLPTATHAPAHGGAHSHVSGAAAHGTAHAAHAHAHDGTTHDTGAGQGQGQGHSGSAQSRVDAVPQGQPASVSTGTHFGAAAGWVLSWLSPLTAAAAVLWFGGAGLIGSTLLPGAPTIVVVLLAVAAGLLGAALVRAFMAALIRANTPPLQESATGAVGTLNAPIRADAAGEVLYTLEGLRRSAPARSVDGRTMPRGTPVVIVRRERGMAWVAPLDPLDALGEPTVSVAGIVPTLPAQQDSAAAVSVPRRRDIE